MQLLQIACHAVEIIGQGTCIPHELLLDGIVVRIVHPRLKPCDHQLIEHGLEARILAVVIEIVFYLLHIILLLTVVAYLGIVYPISGIIELIPDSLNGQHIHAGAGAAVCLEYPDGIGRLLGHLLSAVAQCLHIGDIVGSRIQ